MGNSKPPLDWGRGCTPSENGISVTADDIHEITPGSTWTVSGARAVGVTMNDLVVTGAAEHVPQAPSVTPAVLSNSSIRGYLGVHERRRQTDHQLRPVVQGRHTAPTVASITGGTFADAISSNTTWRAAPVSEITDVTLTVTGTDTGGLQGSDSVTVQG